MVQWLLVLAVTVSSLIGPRPCCCTLAIGHVHTVSANTAEHCCCGLHDHESTVGMLNDEPNVCTPPHRCRCDHSALVDPMTVSKSESETQLTLARQVETIAVAFQSITTANFVQFTVTEWSGPSARAILRALHIMRC